MTKQNDAKTQGKNCRTKAEREEHISFAKRMLDLEVPPYAIALQMQNRFEICRSSAFRDIAIANDERAQKDEGIKPAPPVMEMRDTLVNILFQSVLDAACDKDSKSLPRLTKEIRELMKLGGPGIGRHPDEGPDTEEQLLSQIQYMYRKRMEQEEHAKEKESEVAGQGHA